MAPSPLLCLLSDVGKPCLETKRVVHGLRAAPDHLRVLRASADICAECFLVAERHKGRDAGQGQPLRGSTIGYGVASQRP